MCIYIYIYIYIYMYVCMYVYIYIYIYIYHCEKCIIMWKVPNQETSRKETRGRILPIDFRRGYDTVGNPHRTQISQFELFEHILVLKLDKRFPVEQFEAAVSQSTVPSPPLAFSTKILRVDGFDAVNFLFSRGQIPQQTGSSSEHLTRRILFVR